MNHTYITLDSDQLGCLLDGLYSSTTSRRDRLDRMVAAYLPLADRHDWSDETVVSYAAATLRAIDRHLEQEDDPRDPLQHFHRTVEEQEDPR